jgi:hypothetical protein
MVSFTLVLAFCAPVKSDVRLSMLSQAQIDGGGTSSWARKSFGKRNLPLLSKVKGEDDGTTPGDKKSPPQQRSFDGHSHVEGAVYTDRLAEVEAMGGDPFFLVSDDDDGEDYDRTPETYDEAPTLMTALSPGLVGALGLDTEKEEASVEPWKPTDGKGPKPIEVEDVAAYEWDGNAIEDAHFD